MSKVHPDYFNMTALRLPSVRALACGAAALATALSFAPDSRGEAPAPRPNIIVILVDDMGYSDLGCFGGEIHTPHLDRLAREGVRFTQFYNTGKCFTSRASLLTGLYQHESGLGQNPWRRMSNAVTIAEALRPAGYRTLWSGKWHLGGRPSECGFERTFGFTTQGILNSYFEPWLEGPKIPWRSDGNFMVSQWEVDGRVVEAYRPEEPGFYATDAFTDRAIEWIREPGAAADRPFFLYLAYNAPHWPLQAPAEDIAKYRNVYLAGWDTLRAARHQRQMALGIIPPDTPLAPRAEEVPAWADVEDKEDQALLMATYAAMMDRVDQNVGKLMSALRQQGLERNTLVLFLSDNGAARSFYRLRPDEPIGTSRSFDGYGPGWANLGNSPWRRYKAESFEGGIATPLIAFWPEGIRRPGRITNAMGHLVDIMATSIDLVGASYPERFNGEEVRPLRGRSLAPILRGESDTLHDTLYFEWAGGRAVRQDQWKLVFPNNPAAFRGERAEWQLYDVQADRVEMNDLASRHPERVRQMKGAWENWAREVGVGGLKEGGGSTAPAAGTR